MNPVRRCLSKVDAAASLPDCDLAEQVCQALDELETAYPRASERIVALEAVLQGYEQRRQDAGAPLSRFLRVCVDRRQHRSARRMGEAGRSVRGRPGQGRGHPAGGGGGVPFPQGRYGEPDAPVTFR
ncbi:hypothetical protein [Methylobacterium sp. Leaf118]|uniref:hypothetical protein n=1 Tax=Methylobacterium sp. Leaf118 TaxID=2876562 RepID=UPI001E34AC61|nr:hypothetical protein [Methylobacterium sp. Leaf118]